MSNEEDINNVTYFRFILVKLLFISFTIRTKNKISLLGSLVKSMHTVSKALLDCMETNPSDEDIQRKF